MAYKKLIETDASPVSMIYGLQAIQANRKGMTIVSSSDISGVNYTFELDLNGDHDEEIGGDDSPFVLKRIVEIDGTPTLERLDFNSDNVIIKNLVIQNVDFEYIYIDLDNTCSDLYAYDSLVYAAFQNKGSVYLGPGQVFQTVWQKDRRISISTANEASKHLIIWAEF